MASEETVRAAVDALVVWVDDLDPDTRRRIPDRSVSAYVRDLDLAFAGRFEAGRLVDVHATDPALRREAHLRLDLTSNSLVDLVEGRLDFARAWASGKVRVDARLRDIWELRRFL